MKKNQRNQVLVAVAAGRGMTRSTAPILLVEDDQNDVFFLQHAFETAGIANRLQVVEDGEQAIRDTLRDKKDAYWSEQAAIQARVASAWDWR